MVLTCGDDMSPGWLLGVCGAPAFLGAGGVVGVFGLGAAGEVVPGRAGCCGARFWVFLNVVVYQLVSLSGWC